VYSTGLARLPQPLEVLFVEESAAEGDPLQM
jgi:hypothetical protein